MIIRRSLSHGIPRDCICHFQIVSAVTLCTGLLTAATQKMFATSVAWIPQQVICKGHPLNCAAPCCSSVLVWLTGLQRWPFLTHELSHLRGIVSQLPFPQQQALLGKCNDMHSSRTCPCSAHQYHAHCWLQICLRNNTVRWEAAWHWTQSLDHQGQSRQLRLAMAFRGFTRLLTFYLMRLRPTLSLAPPVCQAPSHPPPPPEC